MEADAAGRQQVTRGVMKLRPSDRTPRPGPKRVFVRSAPMSYNFGARSTNGY